MKHLFKTALFSVVMTAILPATAYAHVVVTPKQAATGAFTVFSISVPNEKATDVTGLRLVLPAGLKETAPTVHNGWTIEISKDASDAVTEIRWSGGTIPAGQRDDFTFQTQTPAKPTVLDWKAYQTYADGTVVSWDQKPTAGEGDDDSAASGPYSTTTITADEPASASTGSSTSSTSDSSDSSSLLALAASLVALIVSIAALSRRRK